MDLSLLISTFLTVFLAELGDKTQLATVALSGTSDRPLAVFLGSSTALVLASLLGAMAGGSIASLIPTEWLQLLAAVGFLIIGFQLLLRSYSDGRAEGDEVDIEVDTRFEANGGSSGNIESVTVSGAAVEDEGIVYFSKMKVRADLDGAVAGVLHAQALCRSTSVKFDGVVGADDFAGDHGIGWCRVTSFVPSGNVASIWISSSISGTPSITSSRVRISRPFSMRSTTVQPSRAPSNTQAVSTATASG